MGYTHCKFYSDLRLIIIIILNFRMEIMYGNGTIADLQVDLMPVSTD